MWFEADSELDEIGPRNRAVPAALALRIQIYQGLKKWDLMREIAKRLAEFDPDDVQWIISYAYASRRALSIDAARDVLLQAAANFPTAAIVYFNLACYECQLGKIETAKDYLHRAIQIDASWRLIALDDQDLEPLHRTLIKSRIPSL
jgi:tetratricopeptide (TPR) repeat protein